MKLPLLLIAICLALSPYLYIGAMLYFGHFNYLGCGTNTAYSDSCRLMSQLQRFGAVAPTIQATYSGQPILCYDRRILDGFDKSVEKQAWLQDGQ